MIRRIVNRTDYQVDIELYGPTTEARRYYSIDALDTLDIDDNCPCIPFCYCGSSWDFVDTVRIFFDTVKVQTWNEIVLNCGQKGIHSRVADGCSGYSLTQAAEDDQPAIYTYHITWNDFANADSLGE